MRLFFKFLRWIIAAILSSWGVFMVFGFIAEKVDDGSEQSMWFGRFFVALIRLVPLGGGIMLFCVKQPLEGEADKPNEDAVS